MAKKLKGGRVDLVKTTQQETLGRVERLLYMVFQALNQNSEDKDSDQSAYIADGVWIALTHIQAARKGDNSFLDSLDLQFEDLDPIKD